MTACICLSTFSWVHSVPRCSSITLQNAPITNWSRRKRRDVIYKEQNKLSLIIPPTPMALLRDQLIKNSSNQRAFTVASHKAFGTGYVFQRIEGTAPGSETWNNTMLNSQTSGAPSTTRLAFATIFAPPSSRLNKSCLLIIVEGLLT